VVFDQAQGNLKKPFLEYDYREEENYVYAVGEGQETNRSVQQVYDAARYNQSIWNRCEGNQEARSSTGNALREEGRQALDEGRPRIRFGGDLVNTVGTRFGVHWGFGDLVTARYRNRQFTAMVRAVVLTLDEDGLVNISASHCPVEGNASQVALDVTTASRFIYD